MKDLKPFDRDTHKKIIDTVLEKFHFDLVLTIEWILKPEPALGGVPPLGLLQTGRHEELLKFVEARCVIEK
jgi:hypothetical protein